MTKREHSDEESSASTDKSSQISEFSEEEEIDVEFDFLKLGEIDFYGLKSLVKELFGIENNSELVGKKRLDSDNLDYYKE